MLGVDVEIYIRRAFQGFPIKVIHADDQLIIEQHSGKLQTAIIDMLDRIAIERDLIEDEE